MVVRLVTLPDGTSSWEFVDDIDEENSNTQNDQREKETGISRRGNKSEGVHLEEKEDLNPMDSNREAQKGDTPLPDRSFQYNPKQPTKQDSRLPLNEKVEKDHVKTKTSTNSTSSNSFASKNSFFSNFRKALKKDNVGQTTLENVKEEKSLSLPKSLKSGLLPQETEKK